VPAAAVLSAPSALPSRRSVPSARLPTALPTRKLTGGASAGLPTSLRVLWCARSSELPRGQNPVPPALLDRCERCELRCERAPLSAALPPSLHGRALMSDDRVSPRPADIGACVPGVQRQQPLLSLSRGARSRLAGARAAQTIAT
jgi:hypothetical protein